MDNSQSRWTGHVVGIALSFWFLCVFGLGAYPVVAILGSKGQDLSSWLALGAILQGLGTMALALGTVAAGVWVVLTHFRQRSEELRLQARQSDVDLAHMVGEQIRAVSLLADHAASEPEKLVYLQDLLETTQVYKALLDGLVRSRPELQASERQALITALGKLPQVNDDR